MFNSGISLNESENLISLNMLEYKQVDIVHCAYTKMVIYDLHVFVGVMTNDFDSSYMSIHTSRILRHVILFCN